MKIKFKKDKNIVRNDYNTRQEFIFDKKTNLVPKKTNRLICIIFSEDKGAYFLYRKMNLTQKSEYDSFRFKKGMYIIDNESIHITRNGVRVAFYLEGVSTPIKMANVEKESIEVKYTDLQGIEQKTFIQKIKGLKFDSKILDTFANRKFAELFTKQPMKGFEIYILMIGIVSLVMIGIGYGVSYVFR